MHQINLQRQGKDDQGGVWGDILQQAPIIEAPEGTELRIAYIQGGMESGKPSLMLGFMLRGEFVAIQNSVHNWLSVAAAIQVWAKQDGMTGYVPIDKPEGEGG